MQKKIGRFFCFKRGKHSEIGQISPNFPFFSTEVHVGFVALMKFDMLQKSVFSLQDGNRRAKSLSINVNTRLLKASSAPAG